MLKSVIEDAGYAGNQFDLSGTAFAASMREAAQDYKILCARRPFSHGISRGKWAGAFVFRLVRNTVLFPKGEACEDKKILAVHINAALAFGLEFVGLCPGALPEPILRELRFYLAKRHINQEALGIIFDTMDAAQEIASKSQAMKK